MYTFDLQFRKDTRKERTGSPTYYRWKVQFVATLPKTAQKDLKKLQKELGCGAIAVIGNQARFSVQHIDHMYDIVIPHFTKNTLPAEKIKDFSVWKKAVEIIYNNKGKKTTLWEKSDLASLVELHKLSTKYKGSTRQGKWLDMAKTLTKKTA